MKYVLYFLLIYNNLLTFIESMNNIKCHAKTINAKKDNNIEHVDEQSMYM